MCHWLRELVTRVRRGVLAPLLILGLHRLRRGATPFTMRLLYFAWSNSWAAEPDYLMAVAATIEANPPLHVLECGSGLSTLVLGELARSRGFTVVALEDDEQWAARTQRLIERFDLSAARVVHAPIKKVGTFSWYSVPADLPERFDLVVCDGPRSGRYGLLPALGERLAGATILADDAKTQRALRNIDRWREEFGADVVIDTEMTRGLAIVTMPAGGSGVGTS